MSYRLADAPMDFDYESASRSRNTNWLQSGELMIDSDQAGTSQRPVGMETGIRQEQAPVSPTVEGPDVEMDTSMRDASGQDALTDGQPAEVDSSPDKRQATSNNQLVRAHRPRQHLSGQRSFSIAALLGRGVHRKTSGSKRGTNKEECREEWEDEDEDAKGRAQDGMSSSAPVRKSFARKRMGNTLNNYYFFGEAMRRSRDNEGEVSTTSVLHADHRDHPPARWTDPEWCLGMAQFLFNSTLLLGTTWLLYSVLRTLQRDVADKVREYELEFLAEIESCSQSFHLNRCGTEHAVPALAAACSQWQRCSAKDPAIVGRSRVAAETVAEIVNGFVDVVSWKSMLFTLLFFTFTIGATNSTLSFFRLRSRRENQQMHAHPSHAAHPSNVLPYEEQRSDPSHYPYNHFPSQAPYNLRSRDHRSVPVARRHR